MARKTGATQQKSRIIVGATLAVATASVIVATTLATGTSHSTPPAALVAAPAVETNTPPVVEPSCPAGETSVAAEHVGVDGMQNCLPTGSGLTESHVDPLYSEVALELLRTSAPLDESIDIRTPTVVCWNLQDWKQIIEKFRADGVNFGSSLLGWVTPTKGVINLSTHTCKRLDALAHDGATPESTVAASALGTFVHETMHSGSIRDEGIADCYAKQLAYQAAALLGATDDAARMTADLSAEYAHEERAGTEYDDPNCVAGSELDLNVDNTIWS